MADIPQSRANPADHAERQVRAYELVLRGHSLREAARIMTGEGTRVSHETVRQLVQLESDERVLPLADKWRQVLIERLNASRLAVLVVLERRHIVISDGQIILDPETGDSLEDDAPVLQAVDRLLKLDTQLAKLTGAEAPTESAATVTVNRPAELDALIEKARAKQAAAEAALTGEVG